MPDNTFANIKKNVIDKRLLQPTSENKASIKL